MNVCEVERVEQDEMGQSERAGGGGGGGTAVFLFLFWWHTVKTSFVSFVVVFYRRRRPLRVLLRVSRERTENNLNSRGEGCFVSLVSVFFALFLFTVCHSSSSTYFRKFFCLLFFWFFRFSVFFRHIFLEIATVNDAVFLSSSPLFF